MRNTMIKKLLLNQGKYETVEGVPPLTLKKSLGKDLRDYKLYGNSIQDGTPTPDTPIEVQSVGEYDETTSKYKIPVVAQGKNLFNVDTYGEFKDIYKNPYVLDISHYAVGTKITISTKDIYMYKISNHSGGAATYQVQSNKHTYTLTQAMIDLKYLFIISTNTWTAESKENLQTQNVLVEFGDTATEYEPYQEPTITNIYLTEPLRKAGTVADYIDFANSKVVRNIKRTELTKADALYSWNNTNGVYFFGRLDGNYYLNQNATSNRANQFNQEIPKLTSIWIGVNESVVYWVDILNYLGMTTLEEFNAWLAENPTYICYATNTPTEELIELPQLPTLKGTTVYTIDTTIQPSNMEVTYKRR